MKLFCLISVLFSSFTFNLKETNKSFSYLTDEEPDITPSVVVPVIPPIGPIDPVVPEITDKSTSFADAKILSFGGSCVEAFQTTGDEDYYVYTANYTNYCYFNVTSSISSYIADIKVFDESDLVEPIYEYTNAETINGDNIESLPAIYVEKGAKIYFKVTKHTGSIDTYLYLLNDNITQLDYDDDSGDNLNSCINYYFVAGRTYYFVVKCYGASIGSFNMVISYE